MIKFTEDSLDRDEGLTDSSAMPSHRSSLSDPKSLPQKAESIETTQQKPRREIVWKSLGRSSIPLSMVAKQFGDILQVKYRDIDLPAGLLQRRLASNTRKVVHRCPGYKREEITFTASICDSAVISYTTPSLREVCIVCGTSVQDGEIFSCVCGEGIWFLLSSGLLLISMTGDDSFGPTVKCTICSTWHHMQCATQAVEFISDFMCQRCIPIEYTSSHARSATVPQFSRLRGRSRSYSRCLPSQDNPGSQDTEMLDAITDDRRYLTRSPLRPSIHVQIDHLPGQAMDGGKGTYEDSNQQPRTLTGADLNPEQLQMTYDDAEEYPARLPIDPNPPHVISAHEAIAQSPGNRGKLGKFGSLGFGGKNNKWGLGMFGNTLPYVDKMAIAASSSMDSRSLSEMSPIQEVPTMDSKKPQEAKRLQREANKQRQALAQREQARTVMQKRNQIVSGASDDMHWKYYHTNSIASNQRIEDRIKTKHRPVRQNQVQGSGVATSNELFSIPFFFSFDTLLMLGQTS